VNVNSCGTCGWWELPATERPKCPVCSAKLEPVKNGGGEVVLVRVPLRFGFADRLSILFTGKADLTAKVNRSGNKAYQNVKEEQ
jgi:hypothetical protein